MRELLRIYSKKDYYADLPDSGLEIKKSFIFVKADYYDKEEY